MTPRTSSNVLAPSSPIHEAKAPSGRLRAADVPTAHRVSQSLDIAEDNTSLASRLFPTPAAPDTIIPGQSAADMAAAIASISTVRPVSGHDKRTQRSVGARRQLDQDNSDIGSGSDYTGNSGFTSICAAQGYVAVRLACSS
jgi:hypothetical protein